MSEHSELLHAAAYADAVLWKENLFVISIALTIDSQDLRSIEVPIRYHLMIGTNLITSMRDDEEIFRVMERASQSRHVGTPRYVSGNKKKKLKMRDELPCFCKVRRSRVRE